jgi:osmotically inducible protein OsmC
MALKILPLKRHATAMWYGSGEDGTGDLTTQSLVLHQTDFSFSSRFSDGVGTNPEELLAASHAGCYTMKLSFVLTEAGFIPERLHTTSQISYEAGSITASHLTVIAEVPGIGQETFDRCVDEALHTCPVTRVLKAAVSIETSLIS